MHLNERTRNILLAVLLATAVTWLCTTKLLRSFDLWLEDKLYQREVYVNSDIVIIGIDDSDIEEFGPYSSWDRSVMAKALENLGSDPAKAPAVVAIDIQYSGYVNEEGDLRLAKAAENLGNVVTATTASYGVKTTFGSGTVIMEDHSVLSYEEPYDELKAVTTQGSINTMYDTDGVLRHAILYIEPEEGKRIYSMQYEAARLYAEKNGFTLQEPETDGRGHYYVSYSKKPGGFYDGATLKDLVKGELDPNYYAGKIVLIGPYTPGLQDSFVTPIEKAKMMYGVEYQANVIQCLLDGNFKHEAPDYIQIGILWILSLAFFIFCNNRKLRITIPVLIAGVLVSVNKYLVILFGIHHSRTLEPVCYLCNVRHCGNGELYPRCNCKAECHQDFREICCSERRKRDPQGRHREPEARRQDGGYRSAFRRHKRIYDDVRETVA